MTKDEQVCKNIALTFDFLRYVLNHVEMLEALPENAEIDFVELDLPIRTSADAVDTAAPVLFKVEHTFSAIS